MRLLFLLIALSALHCAPSLAEVAGVVIVRHAEKADDGTRDPELTVAGTARAQALAEVLAHARIGGLIASQYQRTRQTLSVLARRHELDITVVPAESGGIEAHIDGIASLVRNAEANGLLVIAGHSNTVPLIVEALAGKVVEPIDESEYDRLYVLIPTDEGMELIASRYGAASGRLED